MKHNTKKPVKAHDLMFAAINSNNLSQVQLLINNRGFNPNSAVGEQKIPCLILAIMRHHIEIVKFLLQPRENLNSDNQQLIETNVNAKHPNSGNTALHLAISKAYATNDISILELLIEHNPSIIIQNNKEQTPMALAHKLGNTEIINILQRYSSKLKEQSERNQPESPTILPETQEIDKSPVDVEDFELLNQDPTAPTVDQMQMSGYQEYDPNNICVIL
jgi:ankyrin repeat protein